MSSLLPRALLGLAVFLVAACGSGGDPALDTGALSSAVKAPQGDSTLLVNLYFKGKDDLDRLANELDLLEHVNLREGYVAALVTPQQYAELLAQDYRVEIDEAQTAIVNQRLEPLPGQLAGIPSYPCYRTVEETYSSLAALAASKPGIASWVDIGDSWNKVTPGGNAGYDMQVLVLTNKSTPGPKPRFFLMGAIHAREYTTAELAARFAEEIANGYGTDPDATWLLDNFELHVLPHTNPDGRKLAEQGYSQRKSGNSSSGSCSNPPTGSSQYGIDLNRNSSFKWGGASTSTAPCNLTYCGPSAGSEPEVQSVQSYMDSLFPDQRGPADTDAAPATTTGVMISLHSYSPVVLFPWGYTSTTAPNVAGLRTLARKFGYFNGYPVCQPPACLYAASGTTDDQAYGKLGIAAFTFELGTSFFQSCSSFESTVLPNNKPALRVAFKAARRPYQTPSGPDAPTVAVSPSAGPAGTQVALTATISDTRYNSNGWGTEPVQNIAAARYTVNQPSWATGVTPVAMTASDGAFNATQEGVGATINTTGWAPGRYTVFVEGQDAQGNWGAPTAVFLTIQ